MLTHSNAIQEEIKRIGWQAAESADYVATGDFPDEKSVREILGVQDTAICYASLTDDVHFIYIGTEEHVAERIGVDINPQYYDDDGSWGSDSWG